MGFSKSKSFSSIVIQNNLTMKGLASKETVAPCGEGNENQNLVSNKFLGSNLYLANEGLTLETSAQSSLHVVGQYYPTADLQLGDKNFSYAWAKVTKATKQTKIMLNGSLKN